MLKTPKSRRERAKRLKASPIVEVQTALLENRSPLRSLFAGDNSGNRISIMRLSRGRNEELAANGPEAFAACKSRHYGLLSGDGRMLGMGG